MKFFFCIFAVKDFCSSACIFFTRINKKCRQNKFPSCSQIGTRNQKLHTDGFDGGDQTPARWISIWCSETGGENLCFRSWKFLDYTIRKVFLYLFSWKKEKKSNFWSNRPWLFCPSRPNGKFWDFLKGIRGKEIEFCLCKIFSDKNILEGTLSDLGRKTKSVHFWTLRNRANFTRAGTNGLKRENNRKNFVFLWFPVSRDFSEFGIFSSW